MTAADVLDRNRELRLTAQRQAGALTRGQLRASGIDDQGVRGHLRARRWQLVAPDVIVTFTGPLVLATQRWVGVLNAGPGSAACAWTALQCHGLTGWERDAVHVVVNRGATPPPVDGIRLHESRRHGGSDVVERDGLAVHTVARAAIDVAAWSLGDRSAMGVLAAVVQQGLTTPERLSDVLEPLPRIHRRRLIAATIEDLRGGAQALSELDLGRLCARHGLPVPRAQQMRRDDSGRRRYLDAEFVLADSSVRWVEVDGVGHMDPLRWYDDLLRAADLTVSADVPLLRLPAAALRSRDERVVAILKRYLAAG